MRGIFVSVWHERPCPFGWCAIAGALLLVAVAFAPLAVAGDLAIREPNTKPGSSTTVAKGKVRDALMLGICGNSELRQTLLREATEVDPNLPLARWHIGQVQIDDEWLIAANYEARAAEDGTLQAYQARRDQADESPQGHLELAEWCQENGLHDTARFHWMRVLQHAQATAAQQESVIQRLALQPYRGALLSPADYKKALAEDAATEKQLQQWTPILTKWRDALESGSASRRRAAQARLNELSDPAAIGALEKVFSLNGESFANETVTVLGRMADFEATQSLVNHALHLPWESTRQAAIAQLQQRSPHDYVPLMINQLTSSVQTNTLIYVGADGLVRRRHQVYQEDADQGKLITTSFVGGPQLVPTGRRVIRGARMRGPQGEAARRELRREQEKQLLRLEEAKVIRELTLLEQSMRAVAFEQDVAKRNAVIEQQNARVYETLEATTGKVLPHMPDAWWNWWTSYNELYQESKPVIRQNYRFQSRYFVPYSYVTTCSCFPAGTLVRTESGRRPIEAIKSGDRVLSQDLETGELTYKTVSQTTTRPPSGLLRLEFDDATVVTTKGHLFWVNHVGWRMAKELVAGQQVHSFGGGQTLRAVNDGGQSLAYNLVVDDFATYFVGDADVLVHDATHRKPTQVITPGLVAN